MAEKFEKHLVIRVGDDGEGFVREDINKIWDRFYKGPGGSSGLGLAIVKAVVAARRGSVEAMNNSPRGGVLEVKLNI